MIEFPADDPERARRVWMELLGVELEVRHSGQGEAAKRTRKHRRSASIPADVDPTIPSPCPTSRYAMSPRRWSGSRRSAGAWFTRGRHGRSARTPREARSGWLARVSEGRPEAASPPALEQWSAVPSHSRHARAAATCCAAPPPIAHCDSAPSNPGCCASSEWDSAAPDVEVRHLDDPHEAVTPRLPLLRQTRHDRLRGRRYVAPELRRFQQPSFTNSRNSTSQTFRKTL